MNDSVTVLVTGVGAPGTMGTLHCLRQNFDGQLVRVVGTDMSSRALGRHQVESFTEMPGPSDPDYAERLLTFALNERVEVVLPQTTREVAFLAANASIFLERGIRVAVSSASSIQKANDKLATLTAFTAAGLPTPEYTGVSTAEEMSDAIKRMGFPDRPVVIKPAVSNGSRGFRVVRSNKQSVSDFLTQKPDSTDISFDQLMTIFVSGEPMPEFVVCEYLPGDEYSVDCFRGSVAIAVPRRRSVTRSGISFVTELVDDEDLIGQSIGGAEVLGLEGAFGFQFKRDVHGRPRLLECNPRVQGTMVAACFGGANVIWMAMRNALGMPNVACPTINWGIGFYRYWGGVAIADGQPLAAVSWF